MPLRSLLFDTATLALLCAGLAGCAAPPAQAPANGLSELLEQPAERALVDGIRHYDDGQYLQAEPALRQALQAGLRSPRDQSRAHKLLAFITCTSERATECEAEFRAARHSDPAFALSRSEVGHPLWGPVYRKTVP
ncbi:MAG: TssQ family T6SS-associated lipoprotein [Rubrivivax sp.]